MPGSKRTHGMWSNPTEYWIFLLPKALTPTRINLPSMELRFRVTTQRDLFRWPLSPPWRLTPKQVNLLFKHFGIHKSHQGSGAIMMACCTCWVCCTSAVILGFIHLNKTMLDLFQRSIA